MQVKLNFFTRGLVNTVMLRPWHNIFIAGFLLAFNQRLQKGKKGQYLFICVINNLFKSLETK